MSQVLIIGAGVAGVSAAIFLASTGLGVVVVERRREPGPGARLKIGESLPPDARKLLDQLGVWSEFEAGPHLPCHCNKSYWGSDQVSYHDFMNHPLGHGWHLDRVAFERMLTKRACELGVTFQYEVIIEAVEYTGNSWIVDGDFEFDFVVDASGKNSWFARQQGVDRLIEDQQLALVAFLEADELAEDSASLIESIDSGWWYSAAIPGRRMATAFICKADKLQPKCWRDESGWRELLSHARHTEKRIDDGGFQFIDPPKFVSAESGILEQLMGRDWLAVGDAAMSYDPIASHGIMMAMVSARDAAKAISSHLTGDQDAVSIYHATMWQAYQQYVKERQGFYSQLARG